MLFVLHLEIQQHNIIFLKHGMPLSACLILCVFKIIKITCVAEIQK